MKGRLRASQTISDDVVYDILLRLPVKSLKRFKCVCMSWFSLISSPQFQKDHFRRAQHKSPLLLTLQNDGSEDIATLVFSTYNNTKGFPNVKKFSRQVALPYKEPSMISCQGLVCLSELYLKKPKPILICNPSTEELIALPTRPERSLCVGFGYAASTEKFKVVNIFSLVGRSLCEIFTLGTTGWREARKPPYYVYEGFAPFLHGSLHFLPQIDYNGVKDTDYIAVFDIETEKYREGIRLPENYYSLADYEDRYIVYKNDFIRFTELRGSLCLTFVFGKLEEQLELWLLKNYSNAEWVKRYTINVSPLAPLSGFIFWACPADCTRDESIILNCYHKSGINIVCYNPQEDTITLEKENECEATFYVESFYSLTST